MNNRLQKASCLLAFIYWLYRSLQ